MERLWAPWRIEYIESLKDDGCIFCEKPEAGDDEGNYIIHRGDKAFVILNKYPYVSGHLMVAPFRHLANLEDLSSDEQSEVMELVTRSTGVIKKAMKPDGFNIGANLGKVAGAGVEDHLHFHIVPRWERDTNFMPIIGDTRVVPEALSQTYKKLKPFF